MPKTIGFLAHLFVFVFFLALLPDTALVYGQFQESQEPQCKPQEPTKYDWERLNYYELLGLTEGENGNKKKKKKKNRNNNNNNNNNNAKDGNGMSAKEIRKAYRKQAQKYHPDKQASKKRSSNNNNTTTTTTNNNNNNNSSNEALSVEESNARFAKIAEAYEFLLDESKRKDYDLFLEYCQNTEIVKDDHVHEGRLSKIIKKRFHGLFDDLVSTRDPFRVFKDVFFGGDEDDTATSTYFDPNDPFSHLRYENNPQRHPSHQNNEQQKEDHQPYSPQEDPLRVFHDKRFMYDPTTGENVIRVLQSEEYPPSSQSRHERGENSTFSSTSTSTNTNFYYRIIAQDFRERYDPFTAKQVYVPITEPYLQEDGIRTESASRDHQTAKSKSSSTLESILHPWEVLTPRSKPIVSPNKRYVAGLSPDCELLVMINSNHDGDDTNSNNNGNFETLWGTQRPYGKNGYAVDHCFALLKGPHLVVTVGQHPQHSHSGNSNNRILWHSDSRNDEDDSRHGYYEYEDEFGFWHKRQRSYLAQLDNDGSLTVYSVWSVPQDEETHSNNDIHNQHHHHQYKHPNNKQKQLHSAEIVSGVARKAKDFWHGRIATHHEYDHLYSTSSSLTYKRCVYSTHGSNLPLGIGCYRISRKLHQVALEATLAVRKLVFSINHFADAWLDLIYEEDDIFYFFKEGIRKKNSKYFGKLASSSARWVRKVMEGIKHLTPKQQS